MTWIDSHSHLADPRLDSPGDQLRLELLAEASSLGISWHLQGGVGPEDWALQKDIAKRFPEIIPVFGLHPYWVAAHSAQECESALDQLARELPQMKGLGEIGLDFRDQIASDRGVSHQVEYFQAQLEMAEAANKPIVLHLVRAHQEALRIFQVYGVPRAGGFVHSFNGSTAEAQDFLELGLLISVGGPAARAKNHRLHQAIREIPIDKLLLETDCPDQPPDRLRGFLNRPSSLIEVAETVAKIKGLSGEDVLEKTSQNTETLMRISIQP